MATDANDHPRVGCTPVGRFLVHIVTLADHECELKTVPTAGLAASVDQSDPEGVHHAERHLEAGSVGHQWAVSSGHSQPTLGAARCKASGQRVENMSAAGGRPPSQSSKTTCGSFICPFTSTQPIKGGHAL